MFDVPAAPTFSPLGGLVCGPPDGCPRAPPCLLICGSSKTPFCDPPGISCRGSCTLCCSSLGVGIGAVPRCAVFGLRTGSPFCPRLVTGGGAVGMVSGGVEGKSPVVRGVRGPTGSLTRCGAGCCPISEPFSSPGKLRSSGYVTTP